MLDHVVVHWDDLVRGASHIDCASLSDPVLVREDGTYLYTLPSVVDDLDLGISHIIRGEDHVTNTAVQIQLFEALGGADAAPLFGHHNLLTTASGEGLSKRSGALSIGTLREEGIEPLAVAACAVLTGTSDSVHPVQSLDELAADFDFSHVSRNQARFDPAELKTLSARTLHQMPFAAAASASRARGHQRAATRKPFGSPCAAICETFGDVAVWWSVVAGTIAPAIEDADFIAAARSLLPAEPWDSGDLGRMDKSAENPDRTARAGPSSTRLRLALTGREQGPELAALLPLIGRAKAEARLSGRAA